VQRKSKDGFVLDLDIDVEVMIDLEHRTQSRPLYDLPAGISGLFGSGFSLNVAVRHRYATPAAASLGDSPSASAALQSSALGL
jgi:hypothetical protein